jgi:hypothetical protein
MIDRNRPALAQPGPSADCRGLEAVRLDRANLLAAMRATIGAQADGKTDPLYYLRNKLGARQERPQVHRGGIMSSYRQMRRHARQARRAGRGRADEPGAGRRFASWPALTCSRSTPRRKRSFARVSSSRFIHGHGRGYGLRATVPYKSARGLLSPGSARHAATFTTPGWIKSSPSKNRVISA